jgi:hypothetical protein
MHAAAHQSFHVVWQKARSKVFHMHYNADANISSAVRQASRADYFDEILIHPAGVPVYYLVDGMPPELSDSFPKEVHVLEVSSPKPDRWKEFEKEETANVRTYFMPLLSLTELLSMKAISSYTSAQIRERYHLLGGSTRSVLCSAKAAPSIIDDAFLTSAGLDGIIESNDGVLQASIDVSSTLIHLSVNEESDAVLVEDPSESAAAVDPEPAAPYTKYEPVFASRYVRHQITSRRNQKFVTVLRQLVSSSTSIMYTSVLQGRMFEDYVNSRIVSEDANLCMKRSLSAPHLETEFDFSRRALVEFDSLDELRGRLAEGTSCHPINQGFGAVDFIARGVVGNMTLNVRHGISLSKLEKVVDFLIAQQPAGAAVPMPLEFWWVVPSRVQYEKLHAQPLRLGGRVASLDRQNALAQKVTLQQLVVLMQPNLRSEKRRRGSDEGGSGATRDDNDDDDDDSRRDSEEEGGRGKRRRSTSSRLKAAASGSMLQRTAPTSRS